MKTIFTIFIFSFFIFNSKAQWVELDPGVNVPYFSDIYAITPDIVVVVGANGTILKTTDGGETWVQKPSGTINGLSRVQFPTSNIGYIIGGALLKTTDSGETWNTIDTEQSASILSLSCVNENLIFILTVFPGFSYRLLKSEDGGETWENLNELPSYGEILFVNNEIGFTWESFGSFLSKTENGGETWNETDMMSPIHFLNEQIGFYYFGGLYKTTDSGENFTLLNIGDIENLIDIFAVNENAVWGILPRFLDGDGSTTGIVKIIYSDTLPYTEIIAPEDNPEIDMLSIHFANETTGYVVGYKNGKGAIWKNGTGINTMATSENEFSDKIKVYPNPVSNELNIVFENSEKSTITLSDFSGKQIYSNSFKEKNIKISTNQFPKGTYILSVKTENKIFTKKIIIN